MRPNTLNSQDIPLGIVGGNTYGQDPKISDEQTFNMFISDGWLVPTPGYKVVASLSGSSKGRAIYSSNQYDYMIAVIGSAVYGIRKETTFGDSLTSFLIGNINTTEGDVFIDENIGGQIAICDKQSIWIYNWKNPSSPALVQATLPIDPVTSERVIPGYITYQNGYFIVPNTQSASWFLSAPNDGLSWNWSATNLPVTTTIQTKPTDAVAVLRAPGRGNLLHVFGENVTELWFDVGNALFPYQRSTSVTIDYGCLNANTVAGMETVIAWLAVNEKSGPVIMASDSGNIKKISTDGIDKKLAHLNYPELSRGFFFKQDGHLFYQITFYDPSDNMSLIYDFNTEMFFSVTDENMNYHIAKQVAYFDKSYYFVSAKDGNIYQASTELTDYDYSGSRGDVSGKFEIPRVRICKTIRLPDSSRFRVSTLTFPILQGTDTGYQTSDLFYITTEDGFVLTTEDDYFLSTEKQVLDYLPRIDLSVSRDGAYSFGSFISREMNPLGNRKNKVLFTQLGSGNEFTAKIRFSSHGKIVAGEGLLTVS